MSFNIKDDDLALLKNKLLPRTSNWVVVKKKSHGLVITNLTRKTYEPFSKEEAEYILETEPENILLLYKRRGVTGNAFLKSAFALSINKYDIYDPEFLPVGYKLNIINNEMYKQYFEYRNILKQLNAFKNKNETLNEEILDELITKAKEINTIEENEKKQIIQNEISELQQKRKDAEEKRDAEKKEKKLKFKNRPRPFQEFISNFTGIDHNDSNIGLPTNNEIGKNKKKIGGKKSRKSKKSSPKRKRRTYKK